jgi:hypothetical protein
VCAHAEQAADEGQAQHVGTEDAQKRTGRRLGDGLAAGQEGIGLGHRAAHVDHQQCGQQADDEHHAPRHFLRQHREEHREQQHRTAPADGPGALHGTHRTAAMFGTDGLGHQHCTGRPFTAEAEALQRLEDQQLRIALGEGAQEGEEGKPDDGDLQGLDAPVTIRQGAGEPATDGRRHQVAPLIMPASALRVKRPRSARGWPG